MKSLLLYHHQSRSAATAAAQEFKVLLLCITNLLGPQGVLPNLER
jgi:hypothetical protein